VDGRPANARRRPIPTAFIVDSDGKGSRGIGHPMQNGKAPWDGDSPKGTMGTLRWRPRSNSKEGTDKETSNSASCATNLANARQVRRQQGRARRHRQKPSKTTASIWRRCLGVSERFSLLSNPGRRGQRQWNTAKHLIENGPGRTIPQALNEFALDHRRPAGPRKGPMPQNCKAGSVGRPGALMSWAKQKGPRHCGYTGLAAYRR